MTVFMNEDPRPVSDETPETVTWPDSRANEGMFDWDFETDSNGFFDYF
jgi:hypothetical protein